MFSGNKLKVIVGLLISLILVVAACAPSPPPTAPPKPPPPETLKIGVSAPLSGGAAILGIGMVRGAEMAAEEINDKGGIKVNGETYNIEIVGEDDKYTSEGGVSVATLFIGQGIKFVIGPLSSAAYLAAAPTYEENKVVVQHMASSFKATAPDKPFGFRAFAGGVGWLCAFYDWLGETKYWPEVKRVYRIEPDDATGWEVDPCVRNAIVSNGFEHIATEFVPRGITDASALVMKIMAAKPDLVDTGCNSLSEGVVILKTLRGAGYKGRVIGFVQPAALFVSMVGKEGVEGAMMWAAGVEDPLTPEGYRDFHNKYLTKHGEPPMVVAMPDAYNAVYSFALAMEEAGTLDSTKVRDTLADLEWESIYGPTRWGGEDVFGIKRQIIVPVPQAECRDGVFHTVAILDMKVYPPLEE